MQKKLFLFQMILMLCIPFALQAQETLTVYEGTTTNRYIPAYVYYFDQYTRSQFIVPADSLENMANSQITSLTFYTTSLNVPYTTNCEVEVYLVEVDRTTMSDGFEPKENGSIVYTGLLEFVQTADGGLLTIEFTTPYPYSGGNLLIGMENTSKGSYKNILYYGKDVSDVARRVNSSNSIENAAGTLLSFAPKTTFTYILGEAPSCPSPKQLSATAVSGHDAYLQWNVLGNETTWQICLNNDEENLITTNTNPFTVTGLDPETSYTAKVRANCGDEYSAWSFPKSFTTLIACPAPTELNATLTPGDGSVATLSWNVGAVESAWQICLNDDEENLITASTNPFTLTGLTPETAYTAKVRAICGGSDGESLWSNTVGFLPTNSQYITVNEGDVPDQYIPLYGFYADEYSKSHFIIPKEELVAVTNGYINRLTFYASQKNVSWGVAQFEVYMTEVDYTTFTSTDLEDWENMDLVRNAATLSISENKMDIIFDVPYLYTGENLMIGIRQTVPGTFKSTNWHGISTAEATSIGGREKLDGSTVFLDRQFLPQTTIYYTPNEHPVCGRPIGLTVNYQGGTSAELGWQSNATAFNIDVNGNVFTVTENPYTLAGLELGSTYTVKVQSDCGNNEVSEWSLAKTFSTDACMPEEKIFINYSLTDSDGDGWNGNAIRLIGEDCEEIKTVTLTSGYSVTGSLGFCDSYTRFEWVNGRYSDETGWTFTDENGNVLFSGAGTDNMATGDVLYVLDNSPAPRPDNLSVLETGTRSVTLEWTENGNASSWQIILNGDEENLVAATTNPFTLTGLVPETEYTANVRSIVSEDTSRWTCNPVTFSTLEECKIPTNLQVSEIEPHSATLDWTENGEAAEWVVACKVTGSNDDFTEITTTANPFTLTGLAPETRYTVKVRPVCDFGTIKWSDEVKFPSGIACHAPTGLTVTDVIPTGATISWTGDAESYDLRYVEEADYSEEGWLHHDDGNLVSSASSSGSYHAVMFPAGSYTGDKLTKIAIYSDEGWESWTGTAAVYNDGASAPSDELGSMNITVQNQQTGFVEYAFDTPIDIDNTKNLWIVLHVEQGYCNIPFSGSGDFLYFTSPDGSIGLLHNSAMIRAFVGDESTLNWTEVDNLTAPTYDLDGLTPNTGYKVQVRSNCGEEGLSRWTTTESFRTKDLCDAPYNLSVSDVTSCSATLNWMGWHDNYGIFYTAFDEVDLSHFTSVDEVVTTIEMDTYTIDLSAYSGTGAIAIQHVDPYPLNVDDIVLTGPDGNVLLSQDFDNSDWNFPEGWISYDRNHDGAGWGLDYDGNDNIWLGSWGYESENMDNWLIIPDVELGGMLSFNAWGIVGFASSGAFAVYVATDSKAEWYTPGYSGYIHNVEAPYTLENLQPGTEYEWSVAGYMLEQSCFYWSDIRCTTSTCPPVTDLTAQVESDGVHLEWNGGEETATWLVRYRAQEDENWIEDETDDETYLIVASLEPGLYLAEVKTVCDPDNQACWIPVTFTICQDTYGIDEETACESFGWIDGITYTESTDTPTWTLTNAAGCDSIVTLHLTIFKPANTSTTAEACEMYIWEDGDGMPYYSSGTYYYWHEDSHGCLQIDTLYLTINEPSYTYLEDVGCAGFTYAKNGFLITPEEAGAYQYFQYLTNAAGCDSTVALYLTYQTCDQTCGNDIQDIDENTYGTMAVNSLCWMTSNLRTTRYYDAVAIPFAIGYSFPFNPSDESNVGTYGRLYNWASASRGATTTPIQGACPEGWRLPSQAELNELISYYSVHQLRSAENWLNNVGNNESGFNMQPGGFYNGTTGACERKLGTAYFYTSDMVGSTDVIHLFCPCYCDEFIFEIGHNPDNGYSIRCVRDL